MDGLSSVEQQLVKAHDISVAVVAAAEIASINAFSATSFVKNASRIAGRSRPEAGCHCRANHRTEECTSWSQHRSCVVHKVSIYLQFSVQAPTLFIQIDICFSSIDSAGITLSLSIIDPVQTYVAPG